ALDRQAQRQRGEDRSPLVERFGHHVAALEPDDVEDVIIAFSLTAPRAGGLAVEDHVMHRERGHRPGDCRVRIGEIETIAGQQADVTAVLECQHPDSVELPLEDPLGPGESLLRQGRGHWDDPLWKVHGSACSVQGAGARCRVRGAGCRVRVQRKRCFRCVDWPRRCVQQGTAPCTLHSTLHRAQGTLHARTVDPARCTLPASGAYSPCTSHLAPWTRAPCTLNPARCASGSLTSQTSPSRSSALMAIQLRSSSYQAKPCRALVG